MTNQNVPERTSHATRESYFLTTWIIQSLNCIIYLPRQCGTLYAPQASISCYNFCHIPGKYVSHELRHPPCCPSNDLLGVWSRKRNYWRPSLFRPLDLSARTGSRTGFCSHTIHSRTRTPVERLTVILVVKPTHNVFTIGESLFTFFASLTYPYRYLMELIKQTG